MDKTKKKNKGEIVMQSKKVLLSLLFTAQLILITLAMPALSYGDIFENNNLININNNPMRAIHSDNLKKD